MYKIRMYIVITLHKIKPFRLTACTVYLQIVIQQFDILRENSKTNTKPTYNSAYYSNCVVKTSGGK